MFLKGRNIFITEDNMQNRVIFKVILSKYGADVLFERAGADAVWKLKHMTQVDLIILDLMLAAGVSGFDVFNSIRTIPELENVPIIAVSAMEPSVGVPQARALGFSGFIAKPIDDMLFPKQIGAVLNGEQIWYTGAPSVR